MNWSLFFQVLGSVCVFVGYWLNSNNHPRQHQLFILGHIFLISFTVLESKYVLFFLSLFIIIMQYRISRRKYKFKKDIVRVKRITRKIKGNESKGVRKKGDQIGADRNKKGHVLQRSKEQVEL